MQFAVGIAGGQVRHDRTGIDAIAEQAVLAESLGYDVAFVPDHYVFEALGKLQTETPAYELFFVLATLAQRTTRIRRPRLRVGQSRAHLPRQRKGDERHHPVGLDLEQPLHVAAGLPLNLALAACAIRLEAAGTSSRHHPSGGAHAGP